ncbi:amidase family protein [Amycolatopsis mongoliensis]|uniref:Amidase family protein n=1 Tax=Amycolatopsis mongoliensis TaxID=715475 RepID=A0A9Y2JP44_9PSEU|nr:amidase family protein [Amycolatopsis sp. 4-36]WIY01285.1 amidase family protein [Amycolatopsis sp. 4-36]
MTFFRTATEVAADIRRGALSARELTEQLFARIDASDVNAVVATRCDFALEAASKADTTTGGPLHGVPMTVKDAFAVAGLATTWGEPAFADRVADRDATVVERLQAAGAIVVGKSNVHHMLADFGRTENPVYGRTLNPRDHSRTPGGSSGGAAAALAAGLSFLEYGSDLAGSIRIPAAYCGVYGLKPTPGTVPLRGFQPPGPFADPVREFPSAVGPLARSAADLRLALSVTGGPGTPSRRSRLPDFRVGVVLDDPGCPVTGEVGKILSDAVDALARAGVRVREGWPEDVDPVVQAEAFGFQVEWFFAAQEGREPAGADEQERQRAASGAAWGRYFADVDVFLCPTVFTTAFPHDDRHRYDDQVFWIAQASLPGLPAVSAPAGGALPAGLQVVGPAHEDDTAITFAELAADVVGGFVPPAE